MHSNVLYANLGENVCSKTQFRILIALVLFNKLSEIAKMEIVELTPPFHFIKFFHILEGPVTNAYCTDANGVLRSITNSLLVLLKIANVTVCDDDNDQVLFNPAVFICLGNLDSLFDARSECCWTC